MAQNIYQKIIPREEGESPEDFDDKVNNFTKNRDVKQVKLIVTNQVQPSMFAYVIYRYQEGWK